MSGSRQFHIVDAKHVVSDDGVHVEYVNAEELAYGTPDHHVVLPTERYIADDGAPDGRVVTLETGLLWSDGTLLDEADIAMIRDDLSTASIPLRSKMRFSPY